MWSSASNIWQCDYQIRIAEVTRDPCRLCTEATLRGGWASYFLDLWLSCILSSSCMILYSFVHLYLSLRISFLYNEKGNRWSGIEMKTDSDLRYRLVRHCLHNRMNTTMILHPLKITLWIHFADKKPSFLLVRKYTEQPSCVGRLS